MWKEMNQLNYVICLSLATAGMESSIFNLVKLVPAMFVVVAFFSVTKMTLSCTWMLYILPFILFIVSRISSFLFDKDTLTKYLKLLLSISEPVGGR